MALTRAKKTVTLTFARTRMRNGKHESNGPSRFLREIAPQYLDHPLRKEDFEAAREEDDDHLGFRWGASRDSGSFRDSGRWPVKPVKPAETAPKPALIDPDFVPDPMSSFREGERVEHNRFGAGVILSITGKIPELKAQIRFDKYGEKLLLLKFAKLRHV